MKSNKWFGFTLVELLVVIAIIGILVAFLLPAIQASRESARRVSCTNNIRQLIVAVHDYETAHEHYPAGTVDTAGPIRNLPKGHHISWIAQSLPYLEEGAIYSSLDLSKSAYHFKNDRARQTTIELLTCPSNPFGNWPWTSYAGCHHDVEAPIDADNHGVFFLNSQVSRDDLKDGAAYTLFLGEKFPDDADLGWISGTPSTLRNTGSPLNESTRRAAFGVGSPPWLFAYPADQGPWSWDNKQVDAMTGELVTVEPSESTNQSEAQVVVESATDTPGASAEPENSAPARPKNLNPELVPDPDGLLKHSRLGGNGKTPLAVGGFSGPHTGGVNFAFGDGSVRFIADSASASLMGRLAHREDGNIIDARELP
jgi:prepilin-type N-terminal cleavage/methylation domain-containing protein/prepilin-type processing-associated H-X9-DG protein